MTPDQKAAFARSFPVHAGVDTCKRFHVLGPRARWPAPQADEGAGEPGGL